MWRTWVVGLSLAVLGAGTAEARPNGGLRELRQALDAATVAIEGASCSGVLAEEADLVFTAYHCVEDQAHVRVAFSTGAVGTGWVAATNPATDQAVLLLEEPVAIPPLRLTRQPQIPGAVLYFAGHPHRPQLQTIRLDRLDPCPSLPRLQRALHTSLVGVPGDSGAPIVDRSGDVVGLVHGGGQCQIATPATSLLPLVDDALGLPPS